MLMRHGVNGFKVPVSVNGSSSGLFLEAVREVACRPLRELREIGRRASAVAREQTWDRIVQDFERRLEALRLV